MTHDRLKRTTGPDTTDFTNPTDTPVPVVLVVEKGCRAYGLVKGARYEVSALTDHESGARLNLAWVGGYCEAATRATHTTWVRYRRSLSRDTFNCNRGDPTKVVKFRVVKRREEQS